MLGDNAPQDWGIADRTEWVSDKPLNGEARLPSLEGYDVIGFSESVDFAMGQLKQQPAHDNRKQAAMVQKCDPGFHAQGNRCVQGDAPQRMAKAFDRGVKSGTIPRRAIDTTKPSRDNQAPQLEDISSESVKTQTEELEKRKQEKISSEQEQKEFNKKEYLKLMINAILADPSAGKGAGKYDLSRDDMQTYLSYLDGNKPTVPSHDISEEDVDHVINEIKSLTGKGTPFTKFINSVKRKGAPPANLQTTARARAVLKNYLSTGGISAITGKRIPFSEAQLDHRVSLTNGGIDSPDNWEWVEARFNQFKREFTDDVVKTKLQDRLSRSPLEEQKKTLEKEIKNLSRNAYRSYFEANGFDSLPIEDVINAQGNTGEQFLKSIAEVAKIPYYEGNKAGSGARARANYVGNNVLKQRILSSLSLRSKKEIQTVDSKLSDISTQIQSKQTEVQDISTQIRKEKANNRKNNNANLSESDYLELLKQKRLRSQDTNYSDSMVFYKGKVLGRCPAGTVRSGKTCVPGAPAKQAKGPGYKVQDLGGLTPAQVKALSKARSTEDIIEAHKKQKQND